MKYNFLELNSDKTEIIVCGPQKQSVVSHLETLSFDSNNQVRDLGITIDSDLNFNRHIIT